MATEFNVKCKKCGHEGDIESFISFAEGFMDNHDERKYVSLVDVRCPNCNYEEDIVV